MEQGRIYPTNLAFDLFPVLVTLTVLPLPDSHGGKNAGGSTSEPSGGAAKSVRRGGGGVVAAGGSSTPSKWGTSTPAATTTASTTVGGLNLKGRKFNGPRQIVFVAGGICYSEIRSCKEVMELAGNDKEVVCGGTSLITAKDFLEGVASLSGKRVAKE